MSKKSPSDVSKTLITSKTIRWINTNDVVDSNPRAIMKQTDHISWRHFEIGFRDGTESYPSPHNFFLEYLIIVLSEYRRSSHSELSLLNKQFNRMSLHYMKHVSYEVGTHAPTHTKTE